MINGYGDNSSQVLFKDFAYEFGSCSKLTWNGEVIWEENDFEFPEELDKVLETYGNKLVYSMKVTVVNFHHTELEIIGEHVDRPNILSEGKKLYKEVCEYLYSKSSSVTNFDHLYVEFKDTFTNDDEDFVIYPAMKVVLDRDENILVTPMLRYEYNIYEDVKTNNIYVSEDSITNALSYIREQGNKLKELFPEVLIDNLVTISREDGK